MNLLDQVGGGLWALAAFIVLLGVIITVHEWGHYFVARRCGVHVIRFSIGFGKPLWSRVGRDGTEYVVAAIPLGGYVKMLDEREAPVPEDRLHEAFNRKPVAQRFAIVAAGPLVNLLFAVLVYWFVFVVGSAQMAPVIGHVEPGSLAAKAGLEVGDEVISVDGIAVSSWDDVPLRLVAHVGDTGPIHFLVRGSAGIEREPVVAVDAFMHGAEDGSPSAALGIGPWFPPVQPVVGRVVAEIDADAGRVAGPAVQAGLQPGDRILAADGVAMRDWGIWVDTVRAAPGRALRLEIERNGLRSEIMLTPARVTQAGRVTGVAGIAMQPLRWPEDWPAQYVRDIRFGPVDALGHALTETWDRSVLTLAAIGKMVSGQMSMQSVGGPISIARGAGATASLGPDVFLKFMAFLSISIGLLNLLPVPVLDGGHLVFYVVEALRGKPLSERVQAFAMQIGVFLLVSLMVLALFNDVVRFLE